MPEFISAKDGPSGSLNMYSFSYYELWNVLEKKSCSKSHRSIESLEATLMKEAAIIHTSRVGSCGNRPEWPARLKKNVKARGGHFE